MTVLICAIVASLVGLARGGEFELWYRQPAGKWEEALPIGSGRIGAMVFGATGQERIQFNEDTLWTGKPHDYVRDGAREKLEEIRGLVFEGKAKEAGDLVRKSFLSNPVRQKAYQPFGDLRFAFPGHEKAEGYRRWLDLESAVAGVSYKAGDVTYKREAIASYPDNVVAIRVAGDRPGKVTFTLKVDSPHKESGTTTAGSDTLVLTGQVRDLAPPNELGMKFEARVKVVADGGTVTAGNGEISVTDTDAATVLLVAATNFVNYADVSADPAARCKEYLARLEGKTYDVLRAAHVADYQKLFGRVRLELGRTERSELPTDERLKFVRSAANPTASTAKSAPVPTTLAKTGLAADPALAALFFQYGRYLLIASSRPGTQPANLQGVWNELLNPPWESKYTTNINYEMNYWPAEVGNLAECAEPLFRSVDELRVTGARTAERQYGARGWVVHHNTDLWRGTAPINNVDGVWPTGAAWLCYHLWEHWLFTGDREFLEKRGYPAMKEASLFFVDYLVKDPKTGYLVTNPSISPEQGELCAGPAMDMQLVRAVFDMTTEAAGVLGVGGELVKQLAEVRGKLAPDRVGQHGQLQEWQEDIDQPNNNHRHMSPLWGLFPGAQFTAAGDKKLFEAAKVLLKWRGDGSTGWSYAWRIPLHARVGNAEMAYRQLALQLGKKTLPNLFDLCGPYQIDGNFGATAGIVEMLLQSHERPTGDKDVFQIELLPALPVEWEKGLVRGLRARGGFEVGMQWEGGKLKQVELTSRLGRACKLSYGGKVIDLRTDVGQTYVLDGELRSAAGTAAGARAPIIIEGEEQGRVNPELADGGLPPAVEVRSYQVFRASKVVRPDGKGWTYHHHVDMARWKGRLYVGWDSCEKDEDTWPSRELYSTSVDGVRWSEPTEMFPQGVSTPLRMYFYRGDNGRMLAIAGLRMDTGETSEDKKGGLVVREIRADHTLGEVHALLVPEGVTRHPPGFEYSGDKGFVAACAQLLADEVFLEQQDLGKLLGRRAMKWHDPAAWAAGTVPGDSDKWVAGKAYSFFRRNGGDVVGIAKMGFVTVSGNGGETWTMPVVPPTLVTGKAKVWSQRTADGRYALVYNPSTRHRFPLVVVSGEDGVHFGRMRVVQGELPVQRYAGLRRSIGPQYVRGISSWADDGSRKEDEGAMWVAYSMSKEDVWVSRVPVPVGKEVGGWSTYCPKWAEVAVEDGGVRLCDRDPYDYARAVRVFGARDEANVRFDVRAEQVSGVLEMELMSMWGSRRPVRVYFGDGRVTVADGERRVEIGKYGAKEWVSFAVNADLRRKSFSAELRGKQVLSQAAFAEGAEDVQRISFRTGEFRGIGGSKPVAVETDRPTEAVEFRIRNLVVRE